MFERPYIEQLTKRMLEPRSFIQVLMGPRQVGKSTLTGQVLTKLNVPHLFAAADSVANSGEVWLEQQWEMARFQLRSSEASEFILAVDEIQKITNWSEIVKKLWDEDTRSKQNIKVILLGSSRLLLQQGLTESLAGRFETTYLGHWSFAEMETAFGVTAEEYVWFGGYPGAAALTADEERWKKYVNDALIETSISKDILMLTRVDKPALLRKLFELGCLYSGQILSYTKIVGQLQDAGNTTTLAHYLQLLDTAGLLAGIEKYTGEQLRQRSSSPKFQVHNTALLTAQQGASLGEVNNKPDVWGRWVEAAIGAHLVNHQLSEGYTVHYWRHRNDEIDFVLEKRGKIVGIEVKSGAIQKAPGMEAFKKQHEPDKVLLVGNSGVPWQEFLKISPAQLF
ncbi:ATP-binding protein [Parachryseolinea silvisoli]|uniref:ATP-binding protein n=1 Tax=Parachryseolinea silvisoli TaxID=2873601 RepID=UPI002265EE3B|nr:ATP-binding protein [Parachryseolinea silvisoli]MCD9013979.1 ATP-binding protein [Parachryseolinea silvisoli]